MAIQNILRLVKHQLRAGQTYIMLSKITSKKEANSEYPSAILKSFTFTILCSCQDQVLYDLLLLGQMI